MIKNIIFDLGNVLISFQPAEFIAKKHYSDNVKSKILSDIFGSKEWGLLDKGEISTREAIESIALKSDLNREEIAHVFNLRIELMFPLDQNVRLLPGLVKNGYKLFFLSNLPLDIYEEIKTGYYFFKHFTGGVVSSEEKCLKPDIRIYEILLEKYLLRPNESLFIDDLEENVKAAEKTGMRGFVTFGSQDISKDLNRAIGVQD